jgi:hypothetical protein
MLAAVCSCSKPPEEPAPTPPPVPATPPPVPTPTPTPTPVGTPTPTPVAKRYAPEGIFYVTEEVTVRLPAGIMGVSPGTQVKLVKDKGDTKSVTDGKDTFDVKSSQLTNDLDDVAKILKGAQGAQQAGDAFLRQQQAAYLKQQQDQIEYLRTHPLSGNPTPTPVGGR